MSPYATQLLVACNRDLGGRQEAHDYIAGLEADQARSGIDRERLLFDATYRFEILAERFFVETGLLAPGKDAPAAMGSGDDPRWRLERWNMWLHEKAAAVRSVPSSPEGVNEGSNA